MGVSLFSWSYPCLSKDKGSGCHPWLGLKTRT